MLDGDAKTWGSSPRIRGEFEHRPDRVSDAGIIPANTGRIRWIPALHQGPRDHPREYGENCALSARIRFWGDHPREYGENHGLTVVHPELEGSSPRIRGE